MAKELGKGANINNGIFCGSFGIEEIAIMDPNVHNPKSIMQFLTLPAVASRATSTRQGLIMDFTKSIMLTSQEYMNAALEVRCLRFVLIAEKETSKQEREKEQRRGNWKNKRK